MKTPDTGPLCTEEVLDALLRPTFTYRMAHGVVMARHNTPSMHPSLIRSAFSREANALAEIEDILSRWSGRRREDGP